MTSDDIPLPVFIWGYHLIFALIPSAPMWYFGRRRVHWMWSDFAVVAVPIGMWMALMYVDNSDKSLSNLVEVFWIGCAIPFAPAIRLIAKDKLSEKALSLLLLLLLSIVAAGVYYITPGFPE